LVVFAGEARLLIPLTADAASFLQLLDLARPGVLPQGGTNLGAAIDAALQALGPARGEHEAIVLLTDGEDLEAAGSAAAARAREHGVAVHCVGLGTRGGGKIAVPSGNGETFLRDASGSEVVSALDADGLRSIAEATGGAYLEAGAASGALVRLHRERLGPLAGRAAGSAAAATRAPRFQWFLLAAFVCGFLELAWSERKRP
jgi:Ca-activated chloride channel family protein